MYVGACVGVYVYVCIVYAMHAGHIHTYIKMRKRSPVTLLCESVHAYIHTYIHTYTDERSASAAQHDYKTCIHTHTHIDERSASVAHD